MSLPPEVPSDEEAIVPSRATEPPASIWRSPPIHFFLFGATLLTTTTAGALHVGVDPFSNPAGLVSGLPFSVTLLTILLCHEFGHYALARHHGVAATLPYFIPGPPFLVGTFGAFIRLYGMPRSRRALFDVGAAGPWAGMLVALPAVVLGLALSEVHPLPSHEEVSVVLGTSLLFDLMGRLVLGVDPDQVTIVLHPVALAGWFGLFVTFLNLLPVGQLDGGHVVYALLGRCHRTISRAFLVIVLAMGLMGWDGWFLWAALLAFVLRVDHPDTEDPYTPLDPRRRILAWATLGLFALTFMPVPLSFSGTEQQWEQPAPSRPERRSPRPEGPPMRHSRDLQAIHDRQNIGPIPAQSL